MVDVITHKAGVVGEQYGVPVIALGRRFIHYRNNTRPNAHSRATPYGIVFIVELVPFIQTNC